jgi:hypothetical protein
MWIVYGRYFLCSVDQMEICKTPVMVSYTVVEATKTASFDMEIRE